MHTGASAVTKTLKIEENVNVCKNYFAIKITTQMRHALPHIYYLVLNTSDVVRTWVGMVNRWQFIIFIYGYFIVMNITRCGFYHPLHLRCNLNLHYHRS